MDKQIDAKKIAQTSGHVISDSGEYVIHEYEQAQYIFDFSDQKGRKKNIHLTFRLKMHAQLDLQLLIAQATKVTVCLDIILQGEYAQATIMGAYLLFHNDQLQIQTRQIHTAPHTESNLTIHGVLTGVAQAEYKGLVTIEHSAPFANASQQNKNMLLSKKARATSIPSLEALHNDVQCAHGSAVGQFDDEQLFYMQSRGLTKKDAKKMLLTSFVSPLFTNAYLQTKVRDKINRIIID